MRATARQRYGIEGDLLGIRGDVVVTDLANIRRLAARMDAQRPPGAASVGAGEIAALGLIHEIAHLLIERYDAQRGTASMPKALVSPPASSFLPLRIDARSEPAAAERPIRVHIRKGRTRVTIEWPATVAGACALWLRELLG